MDAGQKTLAGVITAMVETDRGDRGVTHIQAEDEESTISYRDLFTRALHVLHYLQAAGLGPGSHVVICTPRNDQFLDAFWACQLGGMTAVPVAVGQTQEHRRKFFNIFAALDRPFVFSNRSTLEPMQAYVDAQGRGELFDAVHERYLAADKLPAELTRGEICPSAPDDVALIQFSSGSTGSPKGVTLTHANLLANVRGIDAWANITAHDAWFCWAPLYHDMGLIACHIAPLVTGIDQHFLPTDRFARRPLLWLSKAAEKQATLLASPNFGLRHYLRAFRAKGAAEKVRELDLSHVRIVFNAAEPISAELCREFHEALAPYGLRTDAMTPVYGLAEASVCVSFPEGGARMSTRRAARESLKPGATLRPPDNEDEGVELVGVGRPIPGCEIRVAGEDGAPAPANVVGHVQIRGLNVTPGYFGAAQREPDAWLETGDIGVLDDELYIIGRAKDTIILNGVTYHPHDLEWLVAEVAGVDADKVVCTSVQDPAKEMEAVLVFVAYRGPLDDFVPTVKAIRHVLAERAFVDPDRVIPVRTIPRTTSGKVQRFALGQAYLDGEFEKVLGELNVALDAAGASGRDAHTEIERTLLEICRSFITTEEVYIDEDLLDKGASSLALMEICEAIDDSYPGVLELDDFLEHTTVASLAAFVESRMAQK